MNKIPLSMIELNDILLQEQKEYDIARIVNPYACSTMSISGDSITAEATCHHIWKHDHRCSNCFSKRAIIQGKVLYKTEVMGDNAYRIKSAPYLVADANGEERKVVIESVRVKPLVKETVNSNVLEDLKQSSSDYLFNQAVTGVIHLDEEQNIIFANRHARSMILRNGEDNAFLLRTIVVNWLEGRQDSSSSSLVFTQRYEYEHKDYFFDIQLIPFENMGKKELFLILHERTGQEADAIAEARDRDMLTGLYNEEGFRRAMQRLLEDHPERRFTLIRMNIQNFTLVSSVFGMRTRDALLQRLGELFRHMAEETGCACRFHADEFGLVMESDYFDREKLRLDLKEIKRDVDSKNFGLLFRVGIYGIEDNALAPEILCDRTRIALRHAQDRGDQMAWAVYAEEMTRSELSNSRLLTSFEEAIENDEFQMFLQPQMDAEGRVLGAEALVRWIRPNEGVIPPAEFVPRLEKTGMICRMDQVVWEKAAKQLAAWKRGPFRNMNISVNVSPVDISLLDIVEYFEKLTVKYDVDPGLLNIEITETAMMKEPENLLRTVDKLHRRGFHVEIDDFGSGYSSLKMLKDLNADVLKIDREFLAHTVHERRMKTILSSIIQMAYALGMDVIIEGVETKEMVDMLSEMNCRRFQGYYFSKPLSVEQFVEKYTPSVKK